MSDLTHTFEVGQEVSFNRNMSVKADSTPIIAQVPLHRPVGNGPLGNRPESNGPEGVREVKQEDLTYVIEHETGWLPNPIRKAKFGLVEDKKYLFVSEKELTQVEN
jgi:hypothetical protein